MAINNSRWAAYVMCINEATWFICAWKENSHSIHDSITQFQLYCLFVRSSVHLFFAPFIFLDKIVHSSVESGVGFQFGMLLCVFFPPHSIYRWEKKEQPKEITRTKAKSMHSIKSSSKLPLHYNAQCSIPLNDTQTFDVMSCLQDNDIRELLLA